MTSSILLASKWLRTYSPSDVAVIAIVVVAVVSSKRHSREYSLVAVIVTVVVASQLLNKKGEVLHVLDKKIVVGNNDVGQSLLFHVMSTYCL